MDMRCNDLVGVFIGLFVIYNILLCVHASCDNPYFIVISARGSALLEVIHPVTQWALFSTDP